MNLYWQSIKFLRPIYIDWFIHRIETVVNKCTVVRAAPRISPFTTESPEKKTEKEKEKKKKEREKDRKGGKGGRKVREKGEREEKT